MSNRTLPKPTPPTRSKTAARKATYQRQTARLEGRRDGKALIFGWGKHLTRAQKNAYQHRAAYAFMGAVIVAVILVGSFGWLQQNVLIPNETIASVNGVNLSQDSFRKLLAYDAQTTWNTLQSQLNQYNTDKTKGDKGDTQAAQEETILIPTIQATESSFQQTSITTQAAAELEEDQLIQSGARAFEQQNHLPASKFTPTDAAITKALNTFKAAFPAGQTYQQFLSQDNLSDSDVRWAVAIHLRRDMMQSYLSTTYVSPTRAAHLLRLELGSTSQAQSLRSQVLAPNADWSALAKKYSLDSNTKDSGGDMSWVYQGNTDAAIETWALDPARKVGDISPVIRDTSGTFDVLKVVELDPNHSVDSSTLSAEQQNALDHWLAGQKVMPSNTLTTPDATMVSASRNLPTSPNLNATLPQVGTPPTTGGPTGP